MSCSFVSTRRCSDDEEKKSFSRFFFVLNFLNNKKCYDGDERKQEETSKFVNRFLSATFLLLRLPLKAHLQRISLAHFFFCVIDGNLILCFMCKNKFAEKRATTLAFVQGKRALQVFLRLQFFLHFSLRFAFFVWSVVGWRRLGRFRAEKGLMEIFLK